MRKNLKRDREKNQFKRMLAQIDSTRQATPRCKKRSPDTGSTEQLSLRPKRSAKSSRGFTAQSCFAWPALASLPSCGSPGTAEPRGNQEEERSARARLGPASWLAGRLHAGHRGGRRREKPPPRSVLGPRPAALLRLYCLRSLSGPRVGSPALRRSRGGPARLPGERGGWRVPQGDTLFPCRRLGLGASARWSSCLPPRAHLPSPRPRRSRRERAPGTLGGSCA